MYPTLPFGPLSFPTGPILAILAIIVGLEVAGRYGRKLGLHPDDVWNTGLIAFASGLIVARLWNVFQFSHIYRAEPNLILSLRPSGFAFWPGVVAALIGGYAYLLYRRAGPGAGGRRARHWRTCRRLDRGGVRLPDRRHPGSAV